MDLTVRTEEGTFNCRAAALLLHDGKLLVTQVERNGHFFLPGGRVQLGERAEDALLREIREELGVDCKIDRALWLNQAFFEYEGRPFHELCFYFLVELSGTGLPERGAEFFTREGEKQNRFLWVPLEKLEEMCFFPVFLKQEIFHLPEQFALRTEVD